MLGLWRLWHDEAVGQIGLVFAESDAEIVIHNDSNIPNPDFSFLDDDLRAFCEDYRRQGYAVVMEPFEVRGCPEGAHFAVLADPDESVISIVALAGLDDAG